MIKNSYNDSYEKKFGFDIKLHLDDKQKVLPLEKAKPKPKPNEEKPNIFV